MTYENVLQVVSAAIAIAPPVPGARAARVPVLVPSDSIATTQRPERDVVEPRSPEQTLPTGFDGSNVGEDVDLRIDPPGDDPLDAGPGAVAGLGPWGSAQSTPTFGAAAEPDEDLQDALFRGAEDAERGESGDIVSPLRGAGPDAAVSRDPLAGPKGSPGALAGASAGNLGFGKLMGPSALGDLDGGLDIPSPGGSRPSGSVELGGGGEGLKMPSPGGKRPSGPVAFGGDAKVAGAVAESGAKRPSAGPSAGGQPSAAELLGAPSPSVGGGGGPGDPVSAAVSAYVQAYYGAGAATEKAQERANSAIAATAAAQRKVGEAASKLTQAEGDARKDENAQAKSRQLDQAKYDVSKAKQRVADAEIAADKAAKDRSGKSDREAAAREVSAAAMHLAQAQRDLAAAEKDYAQASESVNQAKVELDKAEKDLEAAKKSEQDARGEARRAGAARDEAWRKHQRAYDQAVADDPSGRKAERYEKRIADTERRIERQMEKREKARARTEARNEAARKAHERRHGAGTAEGKRTERREAAQAKDRARQEAHQQEREDKRRARERERQERQQWRDKEKEFAKDPSKFKAWAHAQAESSLRKAERAQEYAASIASKGTSDLHGLPPISKAQLRATQAASAGDTKGAREHCAAVATMGKAVAAACKTAVNHAERAVKQASRAGADPEKTKAAKKAVKTAKESAEQAARDAKDAERKSKHGTAKQAAAAAEKAEASAKKAAGDAKDANNLVKAAVDSAKPKDGKKDETSGGNGGGGGGAGGGGDSGGAKNTDLAGNPPPEPCEGDCVGVCDPPCKKDEYCFCWWTEVGGDEGTSRGKHPADTKPTNPRDLPQSHRYGRQPSSTGSAPTNEYAEQPRDTRRDYGKEPPKKDPCEEETPAKIAAGLFAAMSEDCQGVALAFSAALLSARPTAQSRAVGGDGATTSEERADMQALGMGPGGPMGAAVRAYAAEHYGGSGGADSAEADLKALIGEYDVCVGAYMAKYCAAIEALIAKCPGQKPAGFERLCGRWSARKKASDAAAAVDAKVAAGGGGGGGGAAERDRRQQEIDDFKKAVAEALSVLGKDAAEAIASALAGIVFGDYDKDQDLVALISQIVSGFIPVVDQLGDIRDIAASIQALQSAKTDAERSDALLQLGANLIGAIPLVGSAIKSITKLLGGASEAGAKVAKKLDGKVLKRAAASRGVDAARKADATRTAKNAAKAAVKNADKLARGRKASAGIIPKSPSGGKAVEPPKHGDAPRTEKRPRDPRDAETRAEPVKDKDPPKTPDPPGKSPDPDGGGGRGGRRGGGGVGGKRQGGAARRPVDDPSRVGQPAPGASPGDEVPRTPREKPSKKPGSKKSGSEEGEPQVRVNHSLGKRAEEEVVKRLKKGGVQDDDLNTQTHVKTPSTVRKIDVLVQTQPGEYIAVEVKHGGATRTTEQIKKDAEIAVGAGEFRGKNAPESLQEPARAAKTIHTVVVYVDDITKGEDAVFTVVQGTAGSDAAVAAIKRILGL